MDLQRGLLNQNARATSKTEITKLDHCRKKGWKQSTGFHKRPLLYDLEQKPTDKLQESLTLRPPQWNNPGLDNRIEICALPRP
jgi:hypothetical protein